MEGNWRCNGGSRVVSKKTVQLLFLVAISKIKGAERGNITVLAEFIRKSI